jgi:NAD-dependent SIR2 family protein deacetylase
MKQEKKQIYFSESCTIKHDENTVLVNDMIIPEDERKGVSSSVYAFDVMRLKYKQLLSKQFDNIVVLSGAGTSVGIGIEDKCGKTMKGLWATVSEKLGLDNLKKFVEKIGFEEFDEENTNLEELISRSILAVDFLSSDKNDLQKMVEAIENIIRDECTLDLPENAPHTTFLRKVTSRKLKYTRVKLFTLNYDLLFERAASRGGYILIDGFSYTSPRTFDGNNFDYDIVVRNNSRLVTEDNYAPKVLHLYKPHGSLDWVRITNSGKDFFVKDYPNDNPVLIYPSNSKFKYSFEQPFFEMMSRFQQEIRTKNTLLMTIGFSFYDNHIKTMIMEAINTNPGLTVMVVNPDVSDDSKYFDVKEKSKTMKNVFLAAETFDDFSKHFPHSDIYDYSDKGQADEESV